MATPNAARAAQLADLAHQLVRGEHVWMGSPLTEAKLEEVASMAAGQFDSATLLKGVRETDAPGTMLHGVLAFVWAAGFKVGSMLAEEQRP